MIEIDQRLDEATRKRKQLKDNIEKAKLVKK